MEVLEKPKKKKAAVIIPGELADQLFQLREDKRRIEQQIKEIEAQLKAGELQLMTRLDELSMTRGDGKYANFSITESTVFNAENWDELLPFIYKNKAGHLLQRRLSVEACREHFERKGTLPGVIPFVKRTLNLRAK